PLLVRSSNFTTKRFPPDEPVVVSVTSPLIVTGALASATAGTPSAAIKVTAANNLRPNDISYPSTVLLVRLTIRTHIQRNHSSALNRITAQTTAKLAIDH
ncbi:MAG: hypothetical protein M3R61_14435, partial [Chloroflexota bacterium]|nr:hypothetical protein [Chloroflexota bacterium]